MRMVRIGMVMMIPTITLRSAVIGTMVSVTAERRCETVVNKKVSAELDNKPGINTIGEEERGADRGEPKGKIGVSVMWVLGIGGKGCSWTCNQ
eukprot:6851662-Ditylum_brightwellii.AAC.1